MGLVALQLWPLSNTGWTISISWVAPSRILGNWCRRPKKRRTRCVYAGPMVLTPNYQEELHLLFQLIIRNNKKGELCSSLKPCTGCRIEDFTSPFPSHFSHIKPSYLESR